MFCSKCAKPLDAHAAACAHCGAAVFTGKPTGRPNPPVQSAPQVQPAAPGMVTGPSLALPGGGKGGNRASWLRWTIGPLLALWTLFLWPMYLQYAERQEIHAKARLPDAATAFATLERGTFDINDAYLPTSFATLAGPVTTEQTADGRMTLALDNEPLFSAPELPSLKPIRLFALANDKQALLVASDGDAITRCETLFFFVIINGQQLSATPQFGTCASYGSFQQDDGRVSITMPKLGGHTVFTFDGTRVLADATPPRP